MSYIIVGAVIVTGAISANNQRNAGKAQQIELEQAAEEEKLSSEARELGRRQQLNKALSANIVSQAMSGTSGEGTPQSIALDNARTASISEGLEGLSSRLKRSQLKRQGANARNQGNTQAASTLLSTAVKTQQLSG
ncbi:hypothetical protein [Pseudoalteromonas marina]|uniref:hypothetical protein n=1 Tax=Pseudoalteromonas marina TaxID=267375 RepID=UPI003C3C22A7